MKKIFSLGLSLLLSFTLVLSPAHTQQGITCDSTLMLMVLLATVHYNYESSFDLSSFAFGQLQPLFDQTQSDQGGEAGGGDEEQAGVESGASSGGNVTLDMSQGTLEPGNIDGEPTECAELRSEVELFLLSQLQSAPLGGSQPTEAPTPTEDAALTEEPAATEEATATEQPTAEAGG